MTPAAPAAAAATATPNAAATGSPDTVTETNLITATGIMTPGVWTNWELNNGVVPAIAAFAPDKPFEGTVTVTKGVVQLKSDYNDQDTKSWKPGSLLYKYHLPKGVAPRYITAQGDNAIQMCWMIEDGSSQLWMRTQAGNGTSALVELFEVSDLKLPATDCPTE